MAESNQQEAGPSSPQEAEFNEWKLHPVTQRLMRHMEIYLEFLKEQWASGKFTAQRGFEQEQLNAQAIGKCEMLTRLLNVEFTDLFEEFENAARPSTESERA